MIKSFKTICEEIRECDKTGKDPGSMVISKRVYQHNIGRAYYIGAVDALNKIGKSIPEIAKILEIPESKVRHIEEKTERYWVHSEKKEEIFNKD